MRNTWRPHDDAASSKQDDAAGRGGVRVAGVS